MKRETRRNRKSSHPRPRGAKWVTRSFGSMSRTMRRNGTKSAAARARRRAAITADRLAAPKRQAAVRAARRARAERRQG